MAATINTNIASINAQRNLSLSGQSLNTTMQRLSSGLRVNSAKDDAAGLAIAERMNTQVKGLTVASRNANDGISLAQTAEGALGKVGDMLQRMRELAVQASNATNSASDRTALQAEVSQLAAEIDRVAKQTNFNGQKILDGSFAGAVFQVGANSGDNVTLGTLADTRSSKLSVVNYAQNTVTFNTSDNPTPAIKDYAVAIPAGELKITIGSTPAQEIELEAIKPATSSLERLGQVVTAINNKSVDSGVTAYMSRNETTGDYKIELMSAKTDAEGKPYGVTFTGFNTETTGIGGNYVSELSPISTTLPARGNATAGLTKDIADMVAGAPATPGPAVTPSPIPADLAAYIDDLEAIATKLGATTPTTLSDYITGLNAAVSAYGTALSTPDTANPAALKTAFSPANWSTVEDELNDAIESYNQNVAKTPEGITQGLSDTSTVTDFDTALADLQALQPAISLGSFAVANFTETANGTTDWKEDPNGVKAALAALTELVSQATTDGLNFSTADYKTNERGLDSIDVTTQEGAWIALKKIDSAIDQINASRATLGAMQTRFETAVNNIDIQVENLSAARGRIMDADFAKETAELSRTQILQQAGTAMVAQANQIPQNVLQLLQG